MSIPLRVLIVEDRPDDVDLILHELRRSGYDVERWAVDTVPAFIAALDAAPDVILCDYSMAQFNGLQALALLQEQGGDVPFIVVTGSISEEVAVECMKKGAADYIIKDRLTRLGSAVGQALKAKASRDAQRRAEEAVRQKEVQLRQAQKMEAVGALASGIAHDINNLLTVIYGSVDTARLTPLTDSRLAESLDRIEEAAQQAAGVTKGLLAFARQAPAEKRTIDLCAAIDRPTRFLKRMLPATIELTIDKPDHAPLWVYADETQLQQIVLNLAINARDAMPAGGSLRVRVFPVSAAEAGPLAARTGPSDRFARLQVIDTGTGMAPEMLDKIFDPFFTTKPRGQGTGLGLAITHSIVQEHDGHLAVDSAPGHGTTFTLTLPCVTLNTGPDAAATATADVRGRGELILVVEDYQPVRDIVVGTLRARGYEVVAVADGLAALGGFRQHREHIRALILDLDLPKRSGCDVLREIRASGSDVPAIVVTGNVEAGLEESLDSHSTLLRKPFRVSDLVNHLGQRLCAGRTSAALP